MRARVEIVDVLGWNKSKALHRLQHILRGGKEYSPHTCSPIQYGQKIQYANPLDTAEYLLDKETTLFQQVCGTFLYYAIAIYFLREIQSHNQHCKKGG